MAKGKNVLTTGEVARICNVAPRTVSKWFDNGQLRGYRIPGSKDRRIPVGELARFMKAHNMPWSMGGGGKTRVLVVGSNGDTAVLLADKLRAGDHYEVETVSSNFESGLAAHKFSPHVILVRLSAEIADALDICKGIRADEDLEAIRMIALFDNIDDSQIKQLLEKGFDDCIPDSADITEIIKRIEKATAIIY